ncbi:unnamed protein product [Cylicocyclus nassatus]|uniref:Transmembrane protein n=1 Tax=Cylicocyclus nassatus TaxID=53992 RepID=A0AA36GFB0_CYLNA|nr:unnamed protein product [Cylicocyclus nassatus]
MSTTEGHDEEPERRPPDVVLASILESLRAEASVRERSQLVRESLHELARTIIAIVIFAVLLCIAITEFLVGVIKVNSCPISRYVPIWLIVSGATSFVRNVAGIFFSIWADNGLVLDVQHLRQGRLRGRKPKLLRSVSL